MAKVWSLLLALSFPLAAAAAPLTFEPLQGRASMMGGAYLQPLRGFVSYSSSEELELTAALKNETFGFKLSPWVKVNLPDDRAVSRRRAAIFPDVKEGWAEFVADDWDFRVGNQLLAWGTTDGINPTDLWNPWDMTDPFNPIKLPTLAAKFSIHPLRWEHVALDLIGIPEFRGNRLPIDLSGDTIQPFSSTESRWLQNIPTKVRLSQGNNLPLRYELAPTTYAKPWEAGARLRFLRLRGWDFSVSGGEGVAKTPQVNFQTRGSLTPPDFAITARLFPAFYRVRSMGADAAGSWGDVGLRAETALRRPVGEGIANGPQQTFIGIAGADYTVPGKLLGANLYLNGSYAHKEERGGQRTNFTAGTPDIEPWDRTLILVGELQWQQKYVVGTRAVASLKNAGYWLRPYLRSTAWENLSLELNADFFGGNELGALGQFRENKRIGLTIAVSR